ncbi:MAG: SPFH domain-containing protein [Acidimicrobiales bacterium]
MTDGPDPADIDPLGAAATRPVGAAATPRRRRPRRPRLPRRGGLLLKVGLVVAVALFLAIAPALRSSVTKTPQNRVGISYGGGPVEAAHFQRVVQPGSGLFVNGLFDQLYLYPSDTQTYIVSKDAAEGTTADDSISSPSRDRVLVEYQVAVYFKLNTDRLQDFHEQFGLQYSAFKANGWNRLIRDTFRQQIENALQEETRKYDVADVYANADDLAAIQGDVEQKVSDRLIEALGQPYFCGPTFVPGQTCEPPTFIIKKIDIPEGVAAAFEANRTAEVQIAQRTAEAEAIRALNESLSEAGMNYVLLKAIESGKIDFWVLPSDSGVTLQAPGSPSTTTTTENGGG